MGNDTSTEAKISQQEIDEDRSQHPLEYQFIDLCKHREFDSSSKQQERFKAFQQALSHSALNINYVTVTGESALFALCGTLWPNDLTCSKLRMLIQHGIDLSIKNKYGESILEVLIEHKSIEALKLILAANVNIRTEDAESTLFDCIRHCGDAAVFQVFQPYLNSAESLSITDLFSLLKTDVTCSKAEEKLKQCLAACEFPNVIDDAGLGLLHHIADADHAQSHIWMRCVDAWVKSNLKPERIKVDWNVKDNNNETALFRAARSKNKHCISWLIKNLVSALETNKQGKFVDEMLDPSCDADLIAKLQPYRLGQQLLKSIDWGRDPVSDEQQQLLQQGADINVKNQHGECILELAIDSNNQALAGWALDNGYDLGLLEKKKDLVAMAIRHEAVDVIDVLKLHNIHQGMTADLIDEFIVAAKKEENKLLLNKIYHLFGRPELADIDLDEASDSVSEADSEIETPRSVGEALLNMNEGLNNFLDEVGGTGGFEAVQALETTGFQIPSKITENHIVGFVKLLLTQIAHHKVAHLLSKENIETFNVVDWCENCCKQAAEFKTFATFLPWCAESKARAAFDDDYKIFNHMQAKYRTQPDANLSDSMLLDFSVEHYIDNIENEFIVQIHNLHAEKTVALNAEKDKKAQLENEIFLTLNKYTKGGPTMSRTEQGARLSWMAIEKNLYNWLQAHTLVKNNRFYAAAKAQTDLKGLLKLLIEQVPNLKSLIEAKTLPGIADNLVRYPDFINSATAQTQFKKLTNIILGAVKFPSICVKKDQRGMRVCQVLGDHVSLKRVFESREFKQTANFDEIQVISKGALHFDADCHFPGCNVVLVGSRCTPHGNLRINTSGRDGHHYFSASKARDGRDKRANPNVPGGGCGEDGLHGDSGESAGHVQLRFGEYVDVEGNPINPLPQLRIEARGGRGTRGQNGGDGDAGFDGEIGEDADYTGINNGRWVWNSAVAKAYGTAGRYGGCGGDAGQGGTGGRGGLAGQIAIYGKQQKYAEVEDKSVPEHKQLVSVRGRDGLNGYSGRGGRGGKKGRDGLDVIKCEQGWFTSKSNARLTGKGVYSRKHVSGWWIFKKTTYSLHATQSRAQVLNAAAFYASAGVEATQHQSQQQVTQHRHPQTAQLCQQFNIDVLSEEEIVSAKDRATILQHQSQIKLCNKRIPKFKQDLEHLSQLSNKIGEKISAYRQTQRQRQFEQKQSVQQVVDFDAKRPAQISQAKSVSIKSEDKPRYRMFGVDWGRQLNRMEDLVFGGLPGQISSLINKLALILPEEKKQSLLAPLVALGKVHGMPAAEKRDYDKCYIQFLQALTKIHPLRQAGHTATRPQLLSQILAQGDNYFRAFRLQIIKPKHFKQVKCYDMISFLADYINQKAKSNPEAVDEKIRGLALSSTDCDRLQKLVAPGLPQQLVHQYYINNLLVPGVSQVMTFAGRLHYDIRQTCDTHLQSSLRLLYGPENTLSYEEKIRYVQQLIQKCRTVECNRQATQQVKQGIKTICCEISQRYHNLDARLASAIESKPEQLCQPDIHAESAFYCVLRHLKTRPVSDDLLQLGCKLLYANRNTECASRWHYLKCTVIETLQQYMNQVLVPQCQGATGHRKLSQITQVLQNLIAMFECPQALSSDLFSQLQAQLSAIIAGREAVKPNTTRACNQERATNLLKVFDPKIDDFFASVRSWGAQYEQLLGSLRIETASYQAMVDKIKTGDISNEADCEQVLKVARRVVQHAQDEKKREKLHEQAVRLDAVLDYYRGYYNWVEHWHTMGQSAAQLALRTLLIQKYGQHLRQYRNQPEQLPSFDELRDLVILMGNIRRPNLLLQHCQAQPLNTWYLHVYRLRALDACERYILDQSLSNQSTRLAQWHAAIRGIKSKDILIKLGDEMRALARQTEYGEPITVDAITRMLQYLASNPELDEATIRQICQAPLMAWQPILDHHWATQLINQHPQAQASGTDNAEIIDNLCELHNSGILSRSLFQQVVNTVAQTQSFNWPELNQALALLLTTKVYVNDDWVQNQLITQPVSSWLGLIQRQQQTQAEHQDPFSLEDILTMMRANQNNTEIKCFLGPNNDNCPLKQILDASRAITQFNQKSIQDLSSDIKQLKQDCSTQSGLITHLPKLIALLSRVMQCHKGYQPRDTQWLTVLLLVKGCNRTRNMMAQVATGEGKTTIVALYAAIKAFLGEKVDIITSNDFLASEGQSVMKSFYQMLGLSSSVVSDPECQEKEDVFRQRFKADICYGTMKDFQRADVQTIYFGKKINNGRNACAIVDEVDRLVDELLNTLYITKNEEEWGYLQHLLYMVFNLVGQNKRSIGNLDNFDVDQAVECLTQWIEDGSIQIPNMFKDYVERQLPTLVRNCIQAFEMKKNTGFICDEIQEGEGKDVYVVNSETGETRKNTTYSNGLHTFLQFIHLVRPKYLGLKAIYQSVVQKLKVYMADRSIVGLSGTLGIHEEREFLKRLFKLQGFDVPRFCQRRFALQPGVVVKDISAQLQKIAEEVQAFGSKRPIAIICETIAQAKEMYNFLKEKFGNSRVHDRFYSHKTYTIATQVRPLQPQDIIISTQLLSRGWDAHLSKQTLANGGLHVICPGRAEGGAQNPRTRMQIYGRSARSGQPGSGRSIIIAPKPEPESEEAKDNSSPLPNFYSACRKSEHEVIQYLMHLQATKLPVVEHEGDLIELYAGLKQSIIAKIAKTQLGADPQYLSMQGQALDKKWAHWLDGITKQFADDNAFTLSQAAEQFREFADKMHTLSAEIGPTKLLHSPIALAELGCYFSDGKQSIKLKDADRIKLAKQLLTTAIDKEPNFAASAMMHLGKLQFDENAIQAAFKSFKQAKLRFVTRQREINQCAGLIQSGLEGQADRGQGLDNSALMRHLQAFESCYRNLTAAMTDIVGDPLSIATLKQYCLDVKDAQEYKQRLTRNASIKQERISCKTKINYDRYKKSDELLYAHTDRPYRVVYPEALQPHANKVIKLLRPKLRGDLNTRSMSYQDFDKQLQAQSVPAADTEKLWLLLMNAGIIKEASIKTKTSAGNFYYCYQDSDRDQEDLDFFGTSEKNTLGRSVAGKLRSIEHLEVNNKDLVECYTQGDVPTAEIQAFYQRNLQFHPVFKKKPKPYWSWRNTLALIIGVTLMIVAVVTNQYWLFRIGAQAVVDTFMAYYRGSFDFEAFIQNLAFDLMTGMIAQGVSPEIPSKKGLWGRAADFSKQFAKDYATSMAVMKSAQALSEATIVSDSVGKIFEELQKSIATGEVPALKKAMQNLYQQSYEEGQAEILINQAVAECLAEFHKFGCSDSASFLMRQAMALTPLMQREVAKLTDGACGFKKVIGASASFLASHAYDVSTISEALYKVRRMYAKIRKKIDAKSEQIKKRCEYMEAADKQRTSKKDFDRFADAKLTQIKAQLLPAARNGVTRSILQPLIGYGVNVTVDFTVNTFNQCRKRIQEKKQQRQQQEWLNTLPDTHGYMPLYDYHLAGDLPRFPPKSQVPLFNGISPRLAVPGYQVPKINTPLGRYYNGRNWGSPITPLAPLTPGKIYLPPRRP